MDNQLPTPADSTPSYEAAQRASKKAKACTPCRQQKLKCDASRNLAVSCTRCTTTGMPCYFSATFERKKARSKAEMHKEIMILRDRLANSHAEVAKVSPSSQGVEVEERPLPAVPAIQGTAPYRRPISQPSSMLCEPVLEEFDMPAPSPLTPTARVLDGVCVEGYKVRDCFALFFEHYHPMLPILDPSWDPNSFYKLSPFVFWCLLITGSRRYELDPTILDRLAPSIKRLSLNALSHVAGYFPAICGLAILCTWPLPMNTMWDDPSPMYSGAAMQLALQHGLHMFTKEHASARLVPFRGITHEASLARIWAYLEFVCHCTSWTTGTPVHCLTDAFDLLPHDHELTKSLSSSIFWMQEFEKACTRGTIMLTERIATGTSGPSQDAFRSLIKLFDDQMLEIGRKAVKDMSSRTSVPSSGSQPRAPLLPNPLIITLARVHINAFHFFGGDITLHLQDLIELYSLACHWTQQAAEMDEASGWALYSSESYFRHMVLVATIILRISQSRQLKSRVDLRRGERAYFTVVKFLKRRSLHARDVNAHTATILSELWHSNSCFRQPDGSFDSLHVRFSGRGVMAVAFDCLWYWRRETRQPTPEERSTQISNEEVSTLLPTADPGGGDIYSMDITLREENYFPDLLDDSMRFLSSAEWAQDDYFWI